ncbi:MAG: cytochrome c3 family protein [Verrucomicrobiota bacterium]
MKKTFLEYRYWIFGLIGLITYLGYSISLGPKDLFIPGETSHGHHQIEMSCNECHTPNMGVLQDACTKCHAEELERIDDSHPVIKFKDPRNASRLEKIEATKCITCHREHQSEITRDMGVTLPTDYCYHCHQKIGEQRPSHAGMGFDTCATAGCHNFHDNSSLYERFLTDHLDEPNFKQIALSRARDFYNDHEGEALAQAHADMPGEVEYTRQILHDWSSTAHAAAGVNCTSCHEIEEPSTGQMLWHDNPGYESCQKCHEHETKGFLEGKHGMRLALGLSPMTPGMARIPMRPEAAHNELTCASCHDSHRFSTNYAAVDACLNCHNDEHSLAYKNSKHFQLFVQSKQGLRSDREAVSCATCHMPRVERSKFGESFTIVDHNQNNSLRPNEKMVRSACINCHGLQFSLNALADDELIKRNFQGMPTTFVDSLEMAREEKIKAEKREAEK